MLRWVGENAIEIQENSTQLNSSQFSNGDV